MFERLEMAPADPILGLTEAFKKDDNPQKINLGVGVFKDDQGATPTLDCVKRAEAKLLELDAQKTYLPISGEPEYGQLVRGLLLGQDAPRSADGTSVTVHTPGGTGALRVAGDFLKTQLGAPTVWLSDPTWANHAAIFKAAGLETNKYAYYDADSHGLAFDAMVAALEKVPAGDVVLLHACCHNPTGVDPTPEQWSRLAEVQANAGWLPLFDFAYQGFGQGLDEDAAGLRTFASSGCEMLVCSSFSKNFGLYNERVGALSLFARDADAASKAFSQLKIRVRSNYSNPPRHGGAVVRTVLEDPQLRALWLQELGAMRDRIRAMREQFVTALKAQGVSQDFGFIAEQKGMFSFSGLTPEQVDRLREEHSIYAVRSGRINVAGLRESTMERLCAAVASVL